MLFVFGKHIYKTFVCWLLVIKYEKDFIFDLVYYEYIFSC